LENRDDAPISEIIDEFSNQAVEYNKKEFYLPIMHVIDSSSPEDLAMLAESLVNLSTIRKKYTMNDDDETACGPVDVAIITKKDGFQWIKKK
jgi:ribosomal protein S15P/S13E